MMGVCLVASALLAGDMPPPRTPTGRKVPSKNSAECVYIESIWGSPCRVTCEMDYYPMFIGTNRIVQFRLNTNRNDFPSDASFDFTGENGTRLVPTYSGGLKWVEWWDREPGEDWKPVPLLGCYCNDLEGVVYVCMDGRLLEIQDMAKLLEVGDDE